jgi:hypothetical protein
MHVYMLIDEYLYGHIKYLYVYMRVYVCAYVCIRVYMSKLKRMHVYVYMPRPTYKGS